MSFKKAFKAPVNRLEPARLGLRVSGGEPLLFEKSAKGRMGVNVPPADVPECDLEVEIPPQLRRENRPRLPELSELDVTRHYTRLSKLNFSVDENVYPLGSCTMKYNPRVNEETVRLPGFSRLHPYTPVEHAQGALQLMYELGDILQNLTGMAGVTLVPAAGAHGELAGVMMIRKAHEASGSGRRVMLIPDSAHGTNPATCSLAGLTTRQIPSGPRGIIEVSTLERYLDDHVAGIMITNPNTLGLFEENIEAIARKVHEAGGYVYMDGANLNALVGKARPGDFGVDALHINLHKTFSQPHGGGGPGAGPVVVSEALKQFLPLPQVVCEEREGKRYYSMLATPGQSSVGFMREFYGNFGVFVRAYSYIVRLGTAGLMQMSEQAVLNANYVRARLQGHYHLAYETNSLHEAVFDDSLQHGRGVSTLDIAKRLLDYGFHPPTVYFPLVVKGALMIEPTETESKQSLDALCDALIEIAREAEESPEIFAEAPYTTPVARLDETLAARQPKLRYRFDG